MFIICKVNCFIVFQVHLEKEEFERLFKMSYEQFMRKPAWKQVQIKKELKLF